MPLPTGTVTFLFSDIEGSTVRWEAHREAMQAALRRHDELMHVIIAKHGGHVFKTVGDEFCVAFSSPADAIAAAIDAQHAIAAGDWHSVDGLRVRMALHSGIADERDDDYFGPTVNRVARLLAAGHGEQILVSHVTAELAEAALPPGIALLDLGAYRLKDVPQPEPVFQVTGNGLRSDFPPLRVNASNPTNVPLQLTPFFGRQEELAEIEALLETSRLVTLTGSGGVGKTRVAQEIAARTLAAYPDGAWFVDLAPLTDPALVPAAIASVLRMVASAQAAMEELALALRNKCLLIVLDNCEHVVDSAAACVARLLSSSPNVRVLATSREALSVSGERRYRMPSLPEDTAVRLFVDRARAVQAQFDCRPADEPVVREIVRRLDGIALAVELAASRVKILSLERISKGLDERLKLLAGGSRTAVPRQQTVRALIGWSYDLLPEPERSMLRQLAVFRGGWSLDAAIDVCVDDRFPDWDAIALLESLVEKSLVVAEPAAAETRYRMLESTREYALERLWEGGEESGAAQRHFERCLQESEQLYAAFWHVNLSDWNAMIRPEVENFRAAIDWSGGGFVAASQRARLLSNLAYSHFYDLRHQLGEAFASLGDSAPASIRGRLALARARLATDAEPVPEIAGEAARILEPISEPEYVEASLYVNGALYKAGHIDEAVRAAARLIERSRRLKVPRLAAIVLTNAGLWLTVAGDPATGLRAIEASTALLRDAGDRTRLKMPLGDLAEALFAMGDAKGALQPALEALDIERSQGNAHLLILRNLNVAAYLLAEGRREEASHYVAEALDLAAVRDEALLGAVGVGHAAEIGASGDAERSAMLLGYTDAAYVAAGIVREPAERAGYERTLREIRSVLSPERLDELLARGGELAHDAAIDTALGALQCVTPREASAL